MTGTVTDLLIPGNLRLDGGAGAHAKPRWQTIPGRERERLLPEDVRTRDTKSFLGDPDQFLHGRFK